MFDLKLYKDLVRVKGQNQEKYIGSTKKLLNKINTNHQLLTNVSDKIIESQKTRLDKRELNEI